MDMKQRAIYPGAFDPITNGHLDIIKRASTIFPDLIVAIAAADSKKPFFPLAQRIAFAKEALTDIPQVQVVGFDNLLIDFALAQQATIILRGLRAVNDFEYEFQLAGMNRKLSAAIETLFLTPSEHLMFISSSLVKEIASFGGDIAQFVPPVVATAFTK